MRTDIAGKITEAERSYRNAIARDPKFLLAHYRLAEILRYQGKLKEAEVAYRKAIAIGPRHGNTFYSGYDEALQGLALLLMLTGRDSEAEKLLREILSVDKKNPTAWYNLGLVLRDQKKLDEAKKAFEKADEISLKIQNP